MHHKELGIEGGKGKKTPVHGRQCSVLVAGLALLREGRSNDVSFRHET
jgi:hypothetical protein